MSDIEAVEKKLAEVQEAYGREYAGKDRHLCDPSGLDPMIATLKKATTELDALGALTAGDTSAALRAQLEQQTAMLEREKQLISTARDMGDSFERFAAEGSAANFVFDRYNRHFAGQGRDTRDLGLLRELVDELKGIKKRMIAVGGKKLPSSIQADVELVTANIERYQAEEREIPKAQQTGTPDEQADRLAFLANQQFAIYQAFFAGHSRLTRRPAMLVRMIDNLKRYRAAMFDLKNRGLKHESNDGNIGIVDNRIKAYENELAEIRKVRSGVKLVDIMSNLGGAANELFERYRSDYANKPRTEVNLANLSTMIDKLDEVRRQMEELGRVEKNDANIQNQKVVREYQMSWVLEFGQIARAQSGAGNG
jgi:hypothetical protein